MKCTINPGHDNVLELLRSILTLPDPVQTELIVCSTRGGFLEQVLTQLDVEYDLAREKALTARHPHDLETEAETEAETGAEAEVQEEDGYQANETVNSTSSHHHPLLSPTLHLLNTSQHINLVFCPSITVLRGYLSSCVSSSQPQPAKCGRMIVLNLLALHHDTSEFTLQGLSQTFATAVSAAHRTRRPLQLVECKDAVDPSNPNRGSALWDAEVRLLSGAVKVGEAAAAANWGQRSVSVRRIVSRWFELQAHS